MKNYGKSFRVINNKFYGLLQLFNCNYFALLLILSPFDLLVAQDVTRATVGIGVGPTFANQNRIRKNVCTDPLSCLIYSKNTSYVGEFNYRIFFELSKKLYKHISICSNFEIANVNYRKTYYADSIIMTPSFIGYNNVTKYRNIDLRFGLGIIFSLYKYHISLGSQLSFYRWSNIKINYTTPEFIENIKYHELTFYLAPIINFDRDFTFHKSKYRVYPKFNIGLQTTISEKYYYYLGASFKYIITVKP